MRPGGRAVAVIVGCVAPTTSACGGLIELDSEVTLGVGGAASIEPGWSTGGAGPASGGSPAAGGSGAALGTGGSAMMAGSGGVPLLAEVTVFCAAVCASAVPNSCVGCDPYFCPEHAPSWQLPVRDAFAVCAAGDPMCFRSPEACILDVMYPPEFALRDHTLSVLNLEGQAPYHVWVGALASSPENDLAGEAVSESNSVFIAWQRSWSGDLGPNFYLWHDLDRDGLCESGDDRFGVAVAVWNGSFEIPVYSAQMTEYFADGAAACPVLGFTDVGL